jgi:uncharacterized GH25 family protein
MIAEPIRRIPMYKTCSALIVLLAGSSLAEAHFPFILPDEKGSSAKVVFSDTLETDANVNIEKLANTKMMIRDARGKESVAEWKKGEGFYSLAVPGSGNRVVYGVTDYGVLQKGDAKPFKLTYFSKAVIGLATAKEAVIGNQPLEVVAIGGGKKVKFRVLAAGKPLVESEVTVILPDGAKKSSITNKDGETPEYEGAGRYGVYAKQILAKPGEHAGKKYDEVRNYATLVCDISK